MGARYDQLSLEERRLIFRLRDAKASVRQIAERLGRHRSTIHRELRRNWFDDGPYLRGYFAVNAQALAAKRRRRLGKLYRDPDLVAHVVAKLELGWSPEQIAGRLRLDGDPRRLSHETIYAFIYGGAGQGGRLWELLASRRRKRVFVTLVARVASIFHPRTLSSTDQLRLVRERHSVIGNVIS